MGICKILSAEIVGLWDEANICMDFNDSINILVGNNGSGKTTFLRLIEAVLCVDEETLGNIVFRSITIKLGDMDSVEHVISVMQDWKTTVPKIIYSIDSNKGLYFYPMRYGRTMHMRDENENVQFRYVVKKEMEKLVKLSWISTNRYGNEIRRRGDEDTSIDRKIRELMSGLIDYRLELERKINDTNDQFKSELLPLLLYDPNTDKLSVETINKFGDHTSESIERALMSAFRQLGVSPEIEGDIHRHVQLMKQAHETLSLGGSGNIGNEGFVVLILMGKTFKLIDIYKKYNAKNAELRSPLETYIKVLEEFFVNKHVTLDSKELIVSIIKEFEDDNHLLQPIPLAQLSSGEKQIIVLLTEALLQRNTPCIFIADEPELSLHVKWQKKILSSINKMNPNAQIIVATHSPEIVGAHRDKVIRMSKITSLYEK